MGTKEEWEIIAKRLSMIMKPIYEMNRGDFELYNSKNGYVINGLTREYDISVKNFRRISQLLSWVTTRDFNPYESEIDNCLLAILRIQNILNPIMTREFQASCKHVYEDYPDPIESLKELKLSLHNLEEDRLNRIVDQRVEEILNKLNK